MLLPQCHEPTPAGDADLGDGDVGDADDDCDGAPAAGEDEDHDGFAAVTAACSAGPLPRTDCDDSTAAVSPTATESCNGVDSAGGDHTCAVRATGQVSCWGAGTFGALDDGTGISRPRPTAVLPLPLSRP